jgi:hypothetical protein
LEGVTLLPMQAGLEVATGLFGLVQSHIFLAKPLL